MDINIRLNLWVITQIVLLVIHYGFEIILPWWLLWFPLISVLFVVSVIVLIILIVLISSILWEIAN
ncbi:hypothetical protein LCGC14_3051360, partial [marine sediment metagenome]